MSPARGWYANTVSLAVLIVGGLTALLICGVISLLAMDREPPEGLIAVMGSGVGALATLLVSRPQDEYRKGELPRDGMGS